MTNKLDKIIELMDAHFFKNLKEICEIPAHRSAIEAIINEPDSFIEKSRTIHGGVQ